MIDSHPGRVVGRRYRLLRVIGRGGMGVVWAAQDQTLDRVVAVKEVITPAGLDEAERRRTQKRVLREARAAGGVASVAAVSVFDVFAEDERSWIVMELLEVPTLADVIRDSGPLSVSATITVAGSLLDALRAAHATGVLHRDVKPANVLLTERGAVLGDFGIAHRAGDPAITTTGVVIGSPAYLAPERARGQASGRPADLWALGATLYAAVEGHGPFDRGEVLAALHAIVAEPVPWPRGPVLAPLLLRLLEKDPALRPTADETRELLTLASRGQLAGTMPMAAATAAVPTAHTPTARAAESPTREDVSRGPVGPAPAAPPERAVAGTTAPTRPAVGRARLVLLAVLAGFLLLDLPNLPGGLGADPSGEATNDTGDTGSVGDSGPVGGSGSVGDSVSAGDPSEDVVEAAVPAPFESAVLADLAADLFAPEECFVPSPDQFPFAEREADTELVKCIGDAAPYTATFWCKTDLDRLLADRDLYLSVASGDTVPITDPPAGSSTPVDGVQVAFNRSGADNARVYWDSEEQLCAGELQAVDSDDLDEAVAYWVSGR